MNPSLSHFDALVVGCGFAGAVTARRLAEAGKNTLIIDKRNHFGGNAYDCIDANGILIHPYGPHIFHTNSERVIRWLSRFTNWRFYEHKVLADVDSKLLPIPINLTTLRMLYNSEMSESDAENFLQRVRIPKARLETSEDVVLNSVGIELCEKFFRGYTKKQWGLDLSDLSAGVAARIPTRTNTDDRYFTDNFQLMPVDGYSVMFSRILSHPNITVALDTDYRDVKRKAGNLLTIYTGPIDSYYDCTYGALPYRSLRFDHQYLSDTHQYQPVGTVNYPNSNNYTRITEFKHLTGQSSHGTSIVYEYPKAEGDPYYPIPRAENQALFQKYKRLADEEASIIFVGRLAQYKYYNMDQVVAAALATDLYI